jgi:CheY-like chemotaxis protein
VNKNKLKKILLVDDVVDVQFLIKTLLKGEGYEVICASNGQEALDMLCALSELPDLILFDLTMPIMDGYTFRTEQQKNLKLNSIPAVAMTAVTDPIGRTTSLNVAGVVKKPLDLEDFLATVKNILNVNTKTE